MNAAVITTGPEVIIATATASTNWRSVSQWNFATTPPYKNGTTANPLPNTKAPAFKKKRNRTPTVAVDARPGNGVTSGPTPANNIAEVARPGRREGALTNLASTLHREKSHTTRD